MRSFAAAAGSKTELRIAPGRESPRGIRDQPLDRMRRKAARQGAPRLQLPRPAHQLREDAGFVLPRNTRLLPMRLRRIANRERRMALLLVQAAEAKNNHE